MTGTDPAVEAARRAWDGTDRYTTRVPFDQLPRENKFVQLQITAAREALAPIRELHRPMTAEEKALAWPGWKRSALCVECTSDDTPVLWPCPTAHHCYTSEELTPND